MSVKLEDAAPYQNKMSITGNFYIFTAFTTILCFNCYSYIEFMERGDECQDPLP